MQFVLMGYYLIFIYEHRLHKVNTHIYIIYPHKVSLYITQNNFFIQLTCKL